ncbi:MAG: UvrD-helicase domain-containing protein [Bryobacterales bacterium]|nr:UvrD-helicase domain-containing protein [Bryobacterales bacterium]
MQFRIAATFTDSLAKLTRDEQKAVKTTAFDLQIDPSGAGHSFHKLDRAKDRNFWSVRVSRDIRLIVHRTASSVLLAYVDHHDAAYRWAERRRIERHPRTGAAQIVEVRETVREIEVPRPIVVEAAAVAQAAPKPALFAEASDDELLGYGVPETWLDDVRGADEDSLLDLADHLPTEAAEALLELATGGTPDRPAHAAAETDPFAHPDAQRRFRLVENADELERALEFPWEKWTVFLHPAQRRVVKTAYSGPARVSGSAGTGKTIVALHRAVHLARAYPDARVLLATFSDTLANALRVRLGRLIHNQPSIAERLEVNSMGGIGRRLYEANFGAATLVTEGEVRALIDLAAAEVEEHAFSPHFLWTEWSRVVDAWQLESWEDYRDVTRLGRKTRLAESQRAVLWSIFAKVRDGLDERGLLTEPRLFRRVERHVAEGAHPPFEFCVIDEAQDIGVSELRFLAALGGSRPDSLFFAGDLGQRIFLTPFSWRALGVDVRGRSHTLRINYRTSHQIRRQADRLLPPELADVDGITERRGGTVSAFNGLEPSIRILASPDEEAVAVADWLAKLRQEGFAPHEIAVFVRSEGELARVREAVRLADLSSIELDERSDGASGKVAVATMHLAKGLEFRAVAVMACDDEVLPLQSRIENVADEADLEDTYSTERQLLYVACTRARDRLQVTGVEPASEFLDDLRMKA